MLTKWTSRLPDLGDVIKRFPVAAASMAVFTVMIIFMNSFLSNQEQVARLCAGLAMGGYISVIITLARERAGGARLYALQIICVIIMAVLFLFSEILRLNIFMALGAVLLVLGNAVGWKQARDDLHIWDFTHKLWTGAIMAIVGSIVFTLGMLAIMAALKTLLSINIESLVAEFLMPIGLGFLAPLYWLSTLPPVDEPYKELYENPGFISKAIGFLGTWILAPLTLTYAAIILIYAAKILFAMELPKGEIAMLTSPFLIIGTLTWLLLEPPFIKTYALARWFRKLWFPVSIPMTLLLGVAVFVRISEYGFTQERFILILPVIWAFAVGILFTVGPRQNRDIRIIPGLAAALLLVGAFLALPLSLSSQTQRASAMIKELSLIDENGALSAINLPTQGQSKDLGQLKGQLQYLYKHKAYKSISELFPMIDDVKNRQSVYEALQIETISTRGRARTSTIRFDDNSRSFDVAGFDKIYGRFSIYNFSQVRPDLLGQNDDVKVTFNAGELAVTHPDGHVATGDLEAALLDMGPPFKAPLNIDIDERTRVHIHSLQARGSADKGDLKLTNINFYILMRRETTR